MVVAIVVVTIQLLNAQSPNLINYQGVACDNTGTELANQEVTLKFTFLQGDIDGLPVYLEEHEVQTDEFGLFSINIGDGGASSTGDLSRVNWSSGPFFLKVDIDLTGNGSFLTLATTQLVSVPYSLYAERASVADSSALDRDTDPVNEIQNLSFERGQLSISNGNSVTVDVNDADSDPDNEIQQMSFDGENLVLRDPTGNEQSISLYSGISSRPGADFSFPQGILGEYVTITDPSYTVPQGRVLYVTASERLIELPGLSDVAYTAPNMPVFPSGTSLRNCNCSGFLVDDINLVEIQIFDFNSISEIVVPQDKVLVLKSGFDGFENVELVINGRTLRYERPNGIKSNDALLFTEGTTIELFTQDRGKVYTGYYIDN